MKPNFRSNVVSHISLIILTFCFLCQFTYAERPDIQWMRTGISTNGHVGGIAYSPDGQYFATGEQGVLKLWRVSDNILIRTYRVPCSRFASPPTNPAIFFTPDSQKIIFQCSSGTLYKILRLRLSDGVIDITYFQSPEGTTTAYFGLVPNGTLAVASSSLGSSILLYNSETGQQTGEIDDIRYQNANGQTVIWPYNSMRNISPSGYFVVNTQIGSAPAVAVINSDGVLIGHGGGVRQVSPNGIYATAGSGMYLVSELCHPVTSPLCSVPERIYDLPVPSQSAQVISPNSQIIASGNADTNEFNFFNIHNGSLIRSIPDIGTGLSRSFLHDNESVTILRNSPIVGYDLVNVRAEEGDGTYLSTFYDDVYESKFSPDGQTVAVITKGTQSSQGFSALYILDSTNGSRLQMIGIAPTGACPYECLSYSPDGQYIYVGTNNGNIRVLRTSDWQFETASGGSQIRGFSLSPNGQKIASFNGTNVVVRNSPSGSIIRTIPATGVPKFSDDNSVLIGNRFYDVTTGTMIREFATTGLTINSIDVSRNGNLVAFAGIGQAAVFNVSDGSLAQRFADASEDDKTVKFTPNGQYIFTSGTGAVRVWKISDGSLAANYDEELGNIPTSGDVRTYGATKLDISQDGSKFVYGRPDATAVFANNPFNSATTVRAPFDLDGDGKTDVGIFRPENGEWWWRNSADGSVPAATFGSGSDNITPADFTGDGKTDIAFYRPSTGFWYVLKSEDFTYYAFPFGASTDIPTPGDYDGDGKADAAVFRPSTGTWYVFRSSDNGVSFTSFGAAGDRPVNADYDGDGKEDYGIFRPSNGTWWLLRSSAGLVAYQFGNSADKAVHGDYTGDGKADVAIWRPSTGWWYVLQSEDNGYYAFPFGSSGDIPSPGDYDGDGKFDPAVFRPTVSNWYINGSTSGVMTTHFGASTDIPIPNAFVR